MNETKGQPSDGTAGDISDSDSQSSDVENALPSINEPDVSLDEMLSLACRQGKLDIVQLLLQSGAHVNHRNKAGNTPLLEACSQGHVTVANYLLENGSKIDAPTETTLDSALTWACTLGNTCIVDALLVKNADVEHRTKDGCTALMFACLAGHRDVAEKLLDASSEINVESESNKDSPLTFACWKGHYDVVELLLQRSANIEHRTKEGFSPLMFAALGGHSKVAHKLLQTDAQVNVPSGSNNDIPLTSACWKGHHNVVKLLLDYESNIEHRTKDGCTPLMLAAREGHIYVADLLLKNNAQVNVPSGSENNIPLTLACWKGHWDVVRLLLDHNSDIEHRNKAGCTPLMLASREGHYETTALLLEKGAQVNVPSGSNDDTPLTLACWKGHKNVVLLLLDAKSNIDHQTKTGCTPLMEATREGHKDVAEILLNHNADVELPDNYGQSPLFMACWKGHRNVADLLLNRNAYRDCRTKTGITPLFQACRENHISIVELLLEYGAGVNTPFPNSRENPLTLCAEKGHQELVGLLLMKGATLDCQTKKGCTPIFLSCKEGHLEISKVLLNQGANLETPDCRGNTPIMAAFKNGHVNLVEWLINLVHHLPSDELCHKILMSIVDDKEKEVVVQQRSKCLAIIQEMKKKRELLALKNAQNLVQELDDERDREEKKKKKKAAKRRKQNNRKKNKDGDGEVKINADSTKINGLSNHDDEFDDQDEEENKDNLTPTENRVKVGDEKPVVDVLKISEIPTMPESRKEFLRNNNQQNGRNKNLRKNAETPNNVDHKSKNSKNKTTKQRSNNQQANISTKLEIDTSSDTTSSSGRLSERSSPIEMIQLLSNRLSFPTNTANLNRQLPKTSGVCTQSSSTSGPSRIAVSSQTERILTNSYHSTISNRPPPLPSSHALPITSVAVTTFAQSTSTFSDPRMEVRNIAPPEVRHFSGGWDDDLDNHPNSATSRNSSFDEYREADWKEISRTPKMVFYEMTVPNSYCGRVIGKGGRKINLITEDSGAQITIDKPPTNIVPQNRIITIKGAPGNAEKARQLVTKALNTPSLTNLEIVPQAPQQTAIIRPLIPPAEIAALLENAQPQEPPSPQVKRPKPLPSSEVRPLISYSKVAKASSTLDELEKEIETKCKVGDEQSSVEDEEQTIYAQEQKQVLVDEKPRIADSVDEDLAEPISPVIPVATKSTKISLDEAKARVQNDEVSLDSTTTTTTRDQNPFKTSSTFDSTFFYYDSYNLRKTSEPNTMSKSKSFQFGDEKQSNSADGWPVSSGSTQTSISLLQQQQDLNTGLDRNRSISWTGQPKIELSPTEKSSSSTRSMSIDQLESGIEKSSNTNSWTRASSTNEIEDEQVFGDDVTSWQSTNKQLDSTNSSSAGAIGANDQYDISSSPTSSVSSSKVELTTYFDNDSGVGGSNPLDMTPTSLNEQPPTYNEQPPYLETNLESQPWYQARSAYSAPSSPALPRNADHLHRSRGSSPRSAAIRSHPSMDGINNRPWPKNSKPDDIGWNSFQNQQARRTDPNIRSPDNHDSGLSSPRSTDRDSRQTKERQVIGHTKSVEDPSQRTTEIKQPVTPISKSWSAERFQDVRTLPDLMKQLSLEKYTTKLEQSGITMETIINLNESDLQAHEIPKGPRLKILKACQVIKSQQKQHQQSVSMKAVHNNTINSIVASSNNALPAHLPTQQPPSSNPLEQQNIVQQQANVSSLQAHLQQQTPPLIQQHQQQSVSTNNFFSNIPLQQHQQQQQTTVTSFIQQPANRGFEQPQSTLHTMTTSPHIAFSPHKQSSIQQQHQIQQQFSQQFQRYPDYLSYAPPPPAAQPQLPPQQQNYNFVMANTQQQQQQQQQQQPQQQPQQQFMTSQTNPIMATCDDFGSVNFQPHNMAPNEPLHQNQTLLTHPYIYPADNQQAFYYFHPQN